MPWESRTVMNQREQFVEEAAESRNFSDLCRRYGISRKTGYKWVQRAQAGAPLEDQSRRPGHPFGQTPAEVEEKILAVRSDNPAWGGLKIKAELERQDLRCHPETQWLYLAGRVSEAPTVSVL